MIRLNNVLLVDDDEISVFLNIHVISKMELKNLEVRSNGREALEYLKNCESVGKPWPDLILLDLFMPEMNGAEFLEEFYRLQFDKKEQTQIAVVTALKSARNERELSETFGINFYIEKPLSEEKMEKLLYRCAH